MGAGNEKRTLTALIFIIAASAALRLYPSALTGVPYNTDSWAPMLNTRELLIHSPVDLGEAGPFDDYNVYWPQVSLYSSIASLTLDLDVVRGSSILVPLVGALSPLVMYVIALRLTEDEESALVAAVFLAMSGFHAIITAGAKKETIAWPLNLAALYVFLSGEARWRWYVSLGILTLGLSAAHHLAYAAAATSILAISALTTISRADRGILRWRVSSAAMVTSLGAVYYWLYAQRGLKRIEITPETIISLFAYEFVALLPLTVGAAKRVRRIGCRSRFYLLLIPLTLSLLALASFRSILPGVPHLPPSEVKYVLPYVPIILLAAVGAESSRKLPVRTQIDLASWTVSLLAFEGFGLFSLRHAGLTYRLINFTLVPVFLYASLAVKRAEVGGRRAAAWALTLLIALPTAFPMLATTSVETRYFGSQNHYNPQEVWLAKWVSQHIQSGEKASGDQKMAYLMRYHGVQVSPLSAFTYLANLDRGGPPDLLLIYREMTRGGYHLVQVGVELPDGWWDRPVLDRRLTLAYDNGEDRVFSSRGPQG